VSIGNEIHVARPPTIPEAVANRAGIRYVLAMQMMREAAFARAQARWQGVALEYQAWAAHLDALGWSEEPPKTADSLFLCCACARGDRAACRWLETEYFPALAAIVAKVDRAPDFIDEVLQLARQRLLVGAPPAIAGYDGSGQLSAWLRVLVRNLAIDQKRPKKRADQLRAALQSVWDEAGGGLPGHSELRAHYASVFARCAREALAALSPHDRTLLRMSLVHGWSIDAIGRMYQRDRSVAAKWLVKIKERLRDDVVRRIQQAFGRVADSEFQSLARFVRSQLELSVSMLFDSEHDTRVEARPVPPA
jgi:RNA polymerase sigma-70 factor (ECF subfamily)